LDAIVVFAHRVRKGETSLSPVRHSARGSFHGGFSQGMSQGLPVSIRPACRTLSVCPR